MSSTHITRRVLIPTLDWKEGKGERWTRPRLSRVAPHRVSKLFSGHAIETIRLRACSSGLGRFSMRAPPPLEELVHRASQSPIRTRMMRSRSNTRR